MMLFSRRRRRVTTLGATLLLSSLAFGRGAPEQRTIVIRLLKNASTDPVAFLEFIIGPLLPEGVTFYVDPRAYSSMRELREDGLRDGDVVVVEIDKSVVPRRYGDEDVSSGCGYVWTRSNPLLSSPVLVELLSYEEHRLTILDTADPSCRVSWPKTRHDIWRVAYSADDLVTGRTPMKNARFMPFGIEYSSPAQFAAHVASKHVPTSQRDVGLAFAGSIQLRKPVRAYFNETMHSGGVLAELQRVAETKVIVDAVVSGAKIGKQTYTYDRDFGIAGYLDLLNRTRLWANPVGDAWYGGDLWQAIEYGVVPVVEARREYKGCLDPTGFLRESGAPVIFVDDWKDLAQNEAVRSAIAKLDDAALERQRQALLAWWHDLKLSIATRLATFGVVDDDDDDEEDGGEPPSEPVLKPLDSGTPNVGSSSSSSSSPVVPFDEEDDATKNIRCSVEKFGAAEERQMHAMVRSYYDQPHWYAQFNDSAWISGVLCSAKFPYYMVNITPYAQDGDLSCFSELCAMPLYETFTCGDQVIRASPASLDLLLFETGAFDDSGTDYASWGFAVVQLATAALAVVAVLVGYATWRGVRDVTSRSDDDDDYQDLRSSASRPMDEAPLLTPSKKDALVVKEPQKKNDMGCGEFVAIVTGFWACSIALVYVNSYIITYRFPFTAALNTAQMLFGFCAASVCVFVLKMDEVPKALTPLAYVTSIVPLGGLFSLYLYGTLTPYRFLGAGFIQLVKPATGPIAFSFAVCVGLEQPTLLKMASVGLIFSSLAIMSVGEDELGPFSVRGLLILLIGVSANAAYNVLSQIFLQATPSSSCLDATTTKKPRRLKLTPLTQLLLVGPVAALGCLVISYTSGSGFFSVWTSPDNDLPLWLLFLDCALAFGFNLFGAYFISKLSAMHYVICSYVKDILIVSVAVLFFGESTDLVALQGATLMLVGSCLWAIQGLYNVA